MAITTDGTLYYLRTDNELRQIARDGTDTLFQKGVQSFYLGGDQRPIATLEPSEAAPPTSSVNPLPGVVAPRVARPIIAQLVSVRLGKKKVRLFVEVSFADTGTPKRVFLSPFQSPSCDHIQVSVRDSNGDGVPDQVVLMARRGKGTLTLVFPS
jgi:hypothetical protein